MEQQITPVAYIHTDFPEKFGIPRQSGLVAELTGVITFEGRYRDSAAIRGIEEYSHLWLIWGFSASVKEEPPLTVHPPRLGGKVKKGVFATRSPFRPNSLGLSCVKVENIVIDEEKGPVITVSGVDMMDGSPIYDIKPYMPYSDSIPDARGGTGNGRKDLHIDVDFPENLLNILPEEKKSAAVHLLEEDPRAAYNKSPGSVFGLRFSGFDIRFVAQEGRLSVIDVIKDDGSITNIK